MSSRFVRPSKYRHVYGNPAKTEVSYQNVRPSNNAWDTNFLAANSKYISLNWQAGGGGAFAIIPTSRTGKLPDLYPLARGHAATVLDTAFSPFDDSVVVSAGDDGQIGVWKLDDSVFDVLDMNAKELEAHGGVRDLVPSAKISASSRKVGQVLFHPTAANTVAAAGGDHTIKLWDIEKQADRSTLFGFTDAVQSLDFDWTGNTLVATCRDRKIRTYDPRQGGAPVQTADSHPGVKGSRVIWCGSTDRIVTTGFSKTSDRQLFLWDSKNLNTPLKTTVIDSSSGVMMPFWSDNSVIFLAGKGDGNIRYYELESDELHYLSEYKSTDPQRGMTFLPRRDLNADDNEIARAYKLTNNMIQPVSFICPRKADAFQTDIFPPAPSSVPALSGDEFFAGKSALPNLIELQHGKGVDSKTALSSATSSSIAPAASSASGDKTPSSTAATSAPASKAATPTTSSATAPATSLPEPTRASRATAEPATSTVSAPAPAPTSAPAASRFKQPSSVRPASPTKASEASKSTYSFLKENGSSASAAAAPSQSSASQSSTAARSTPAAASTSTSSPVSTPAPSASSLTTGISSLLEQLQRLNAESAARDARLHELELENQRLKAGNGAASGSGSGSTSSTFSADRFFETQTAPNNLDEFSSKARSFVERHHKQGRKVVLVTSGGTTVPLERNVVRFLDNFSAGTRGATSAEYFLSAGYAVIFMHRQHSLSPYTRHYSHTTNPFLDLLDDPSKHAGEHDSEGIRVQPSSTEQLRPVLKDYLLHSRSEEQGGKGTLLRLPFVTVNDYLFLLREMSRVMEPLGRKGMYYLAAAVSDFFVPNQRTPEHKIQSGKGSLVIEMDQVPKVLNSMVKKWVPEGFIVSFKLETDIDLLIPKASMALERYGHQIVVANDLHSRKEQVCFVFNNGEQRKGGETKWLKLNSEAVKMGKEIEEDIVKELATRHQRWIQDGHL
ncbi:unnamed protein product [Sympodiomycopsis kandeliae]